MRGVSSSMSGRRVGTLGRLPRPDKKIAYDPGRMRTAYRSRTAGSAPRANGCAGRRPASTATARHTRRRRRRPAGDLTRDLGPHPPHRHHLGHPHLTCSPCSCSCTRHPLATRCSCSSVSHSSSWPSCSWWPPSLSTSRRDGPFRELAAVCFLLPGPDPGALGPLREGVGSCPPGAGQESGREARVTKNLPSCGLAARLGALSLGFMRQY